MSQSLSPNPAHEAAFRELMGLFATGVCVVSLGRSEAGEDAAISGTTVNSLVSISLDPMLVCWSLQNDASQFAEYSQAKEFAISILASDQAALARRYAARGDTALVTSDFERTDRGLPVIKGALASLECRLWKTYPAGDHTMILGEVVAMNGWQDEAEPKALGFFGGRFCAIEG